MLNPVYYRTHKSIIKQNDVIINLNSALPTFVIGWKITLSYA